MVMPKGGGFLPPIVFADKQHLYNAYMPFVKGGGIFIANPRPFKLGQEVFVPLILPDTPEKLPVAGKVIWVTPKGAQGNRPAGFGIQFSDKDEGSQLAKKRIEDLLGGMVESDRPTFTM